jgi:hypothetical protein
MVVKDDLKPPVPTPLNREVSEVAFGALRTSLEVAVNALSQLLC